jgi:hypothetical protein
MKEYVKKLSYNFIQQARASASLVEDMAAMERYLAESYNERAFIELLQNADDANSYRVKIIWHNGDLIFANDGRPFTEMDIHAISRSGASTKVRGEKIGYRGIGFKSAVCFSDFIIIFSNNCFFSFSKKLTSKYLDMTEDKVPTVRIPLLLDDRLLKPSTKNLIASLQQEGYQTVFVFCDANLEKVHNELHGISMGCLLFLSSLDSIIVDVGEKVNHFTIKRNNYADCKEVVITDELRGYSRKWYIRSCNRRAIAYMEEIADDSFEDVFHCFLPTLDTTGFCFRINADFTTDPSRKHLMMDEQTQVELSESGKLVADIVADEYIHKKPFVNHIIKGFSNQKSSNIFSSMLDMEIKNQLQNRSWVKTITGSYRTPPKCIILPQWYTDSLNKYIVTTTEMKLYDRFVVEENSEYRKAFIKLGMIESKPENFMGLLLDKTIINQLPEEITIAVIGDVIKDIRMRDLKDNLNNVFHWYVKIDDKVRSIYEITNSENEAEAFYKSLTKYCTNNSDVIWFFKKVNISTLFLNDARKNNDLKLKSFRKEFNEMLPKWRIAEDVCVELERRFGNKSQDVSKQNLGYDVLSETNHGEKRYIEVKSVNRIGDPVTLTNNEYSCANQYGESYYLCIVARNRSLTNVVYVQNPLKNGQLDKRVKVWEWLFDNYSGEQYII